MPPILGLSLSLSVYFPSFALAHEFLCIYHPVFILPCLGFSFIFLSSFSNTASNGFHLLNVLVYEYCSFRRTEEETVLG